MMNKKLEEVFSNIALKHRDNNPSNNNGNASVEQLIERDLSTITSDKRMAIFEALEGDSELDFNEIQSKTKIDDSILAYHISQLVKYNWVDKRTTPEQNYYKMTEKAKDYMSIIHKYA